MFIIKPQKNHQHMIQQKKKIGEHQIPPGLCDGVYNSSVTTKLLLLTD